MTYYKIIVDNKIIGVENADGFRLYQKKNNIILFSNVDSAQYFEYNGVLYRDNWLRAVENPDIKYQEARIIRIEEDEYDSLVEALEIKQEIAIEEPIEEIEEVEEDPDATFEFLLDTKLKELRYNCQKAIESGIDLELSDGNVHHFSLTAQDQLNLLNAMLQASGRSIKGIIYHADGEEYKEYSKADIKLISEKAEEYKLMHLNYHKRIKEYVLTLKTKEELKNVYYGMDLQMHD